MPIMRYLGQPYPLSPTPGRATHILTQRHDEWRRGLGDFLRMNRAVEKGTCKSGAHVRIEDVKSGPGHRRRIEGTLSLGVVGATQVAATLWLGTSERKNEPDDKKE